LGEQKAKNGVTSAEKSDLSTEASLEAQSGHCVLELKGIVTRREKEKMGFWSSGFSRSGRPHALGLRSDKGYERENESHWWAELAELGQRGPGPLRRRGHPAADCGLASRIF
jgi:hypothetical protein